MGHRQATRNTHLAPPVGSAASHHLLIGPLSALASSEFMFTSVIE
jgi:hypothetical protein